jgi:hypothetical protein
LAAGVVVRIRTVICDVFDKNVDDRGAETDHSLAVFLLFQGSIGFGTVIEVKQLIIDMEVEEIEGSKATHSGADVPQHFEGSMVVLGSVGVGFSEIVEKGCRIVAVEFDVARLITLGDVGNIDLLGEIFVDGLDAFEELDVIF